MIMEGAELGVWSLQDKAAQNRLLAAHRKEKLGEGVTSVRAPARPATPSAASIIQTRPIDPDPIPEDPVVRKLPPAGGTGSGVSLPPPPAENEILG